MRPRTASVRTARLAAAVAALVALAALALGASTANAMVVQPDAANGDIVAAMLDDEATVKTYTRKGAKVVLLPANPALEPMEFDPSEVAIYGKVVTVMPGGMVSTTSSR